MHRFALQAPARPEALAVLATTPGVTIRTESSIEASWDVAALVAQRLGVPEPPLAPPRLALVRSPVEVRGGRRCLDYQLDDAVAAAIGERPFVWNAPGTGKTAILILAVELIAGFPVLVIAPAKGRESWVRDLVWLGDNRSTVIVTGESDDTASATAAARRADTRLQRYRDEGVDARVTNKLSEALANPPHFLVVGWETLDARLPQLKTRGWGTLILDEAHHIKNHRSAQAKALRRLRCMRVFEATATPVSNTSKDLLSQLEVAAPSVWSGYTTPPDFEKAAPKFLVRYCHAQPNAYLGLDATGPHDPRECPQCADATVELAYRLGLQASMRSRASVAAALPPFTWDTVTIDVNNAQAAQHAAAGRRGVEAALEVAAEIKRVSILDMTIEALLAGQKVVVVGIRKRWVQQMTGEVRNRALKHPRLRQNLWLAGITGDYPVDVAERLELLDTYNRKVPDTACIVVNMQAIAEAVELQHTDQCILGALPVTPHALEQLLGRFGRLGGRSLFLRATHAVGTIDDRILEILRPKLQVVSALGFKGVGATSGLAGVESRSSTVDESDEQVMARLSAWLQETTRDGAVEGALPLGDE